MRSNGRPDSAGRRLVAGPLRLLPIVGLVSLLHGAGLWRAVCLLPDQRLQASGPLALSVRMIVTDRPSPVSFIDGQKLMALTAAAARTSADAQTSTTNATVAAQAAEPRNPSLIGAVNQSAISAATLNQPSAIARPVLRDEATLPSDGRIVKASQPTTPATAASGAIIRPSDSAAVGASPQLALPSVAPSSPSSSTQAFLKAGTPLLQPPVLQLPLAPDYLSGLHLDPGPQPLGLIEPVYPDEADAQSGYVVLRLLINETGSVDNAAVVRSYPRGLFEASAVQAFSRARFSPGKLLGLSVKSQITIEVQFTPINQGAKTGRVY